MIPYNKHIYQDILIPDSKRDHARTGQYVFIDITQQPSKYIHPVGQIVEVKITK